jgi:uncharacterized protein DUF3828/sporulation and spore germination protein
MKIIKTFLILVTLVVGLNFSVAAQQRSKLTKQNSPDALVADLYRQHKKQSPFFQTRSRALVDKYFDKQLGDLLWKDAITSKGEVGVIDGDPLYNAQDMEIKKCSIHKAVVENGTADVLVTFENFGNKKEITFQLIPRKTGWKIANIKYDDGSNILGWFKDASQSASGSAGQQVKVYLVAVGDNGRAGKKIGCDDSLVAVTRTIKPTAAPLTAALRELLATPSQPDGTPKLENFWKGRNLKVESVSIRKHVATIRMSGELFVAGVCDEPRIESQVEETARQFPTVKQVRVFLGKRRLSEAIR